MTLGVGTSTTSTGTAARPIDPATTGAAADPNAASADPQAGSTEPATDEFVDTAAGSEEWSEFSDTQPVGLSAPAQPIVSADALTASPEVGTGSDLGTLGATSTAITSSSWGLSATDPTATGPAPAGLQPVLDEAHAAPGPAGVDAIIAREAANLDGVYGSLEGMSEEQRLATIGQLSELSELAGPEGQAALATGLVDHMDLENGNSEKSNGVLRGLQNAVFEGDGATLAVNVTSELMTRTETSAYDLGTRLALGTGDAMSVLRTEVESASGEYETALSAIDRQIASEGLTGDAAAARFRELATTPEMQALDSRLYWASERYRSVVPGARAALASGPINQSASQFTAFLANESKLATDPARLVHADTMRTAVGLSVLSGGGPQVGTIGMPPGIRPQLDPKTGEIVRFHPSFELALNQALMEVGAPGPDATPVYGKLGDLNGKFVGFQWDGGKKGFRIDWHATNGGHVNWWDYSAGTKRGAGARNGAEYFPGTKREFDRRVQTYQRFDPAVRQQAVQAASNSWNPVDKIAAITGLTGAALVVYLIISEGSRLFPPRNLVPVP